MHAVRQTAGDGTITTQSFNPASGRLATLCATRNAGTCDGATANQAFDFDTTGNLDERDDTFNGSVESFTTDKLNRMIASTLTVGAGAPSTLAMTYDLAGNILSKSDTGAYGYAGASHQLASIATCAGCAVNGVTNPAYAYDADGNMLSGAGRTVSYTAFNMTAVANTGQPSATAFGYDAGHARAQMTTPAGATLYLNAGNGVMNERFVPTTGTPSWRNYIMADGHIVAQRITKGSSVTLNYFVLDHLGSVVAVTDSQSSTVVRHQAAISLAEFKLSRRAREQEWRPLLKGRMPNQIAAIAPMPGIDVMLKILAAPA